MRRVSSTTRWPTCRSGAVGSRPSFTRSLSPRASRARRWSSTWISTARSRSRSKNDTLKLKSGYGAAAEVLIRVVGQNRRKDGDHGFADVVDQRHEQVRIFHGVVE